MDSIKKLTELKEMLDKELITQAEFHKLKGELLAEKEQPIPQIERAEQPVLDKKYKPSSIIAASWLLSIAIVWSFYNATVIFSSADRLGLDLSMRLWVCLTTFGVLGVYIAFFFLIWNRVGKSVMGLAILIVIEASINIKGFDLEQIVTFKSLSNLLFGYLVPLLIIILLRVKSSKNWFNTSDKLMTARTVLLVFIISIGLMLTCGYLVNSMGVQKIEDAAGRGGEWEAEGNFED